MEKIFIKPIEEKNLEELFTIFSEISLSGVCWPYAYNLSQEKFKEIWFASGNTGYAAVIDGSMAGAYFVKNQWPDRGSHVATAQYMVSSHFRGRGIGFLLGEHSLKTTKELGFSALQFNLVVSTNKPALKLYEKLGFKIAGRLPSSFDHPQLGLVDTFVMHRFIN